MFRSPDLETKIEMLEKENAELKSRLSVPENDDWRWKNQTLIRFMKVALLPLYIIFQPIIYVGRLIHGYIWHRNIGFHYVDPNDVDILLIGWRLKSVYQYKNWLEHEKK